MFVHPFFFFLFTAFFIINDHITFIEIIVCLNTASLPLLASFVAGAGHFLLEDVFLECRVEFLTMLLAIIVYLLGEFVEGFESMFRPPSPC
jgi:hypothetical protein